MQRPLFVGEGQRCHSLSELRDLYANGTGGERAALLDELCAQYRSGRLALWLRSCLREGVRSKRVMLATARARRTSDALRTWMDARREKACQLLGSAEAPALPLTFDVLREGVLDPDIDGPLLGELLCELVGADASAASGAEASESAAAADTPPATDAVEPGGGPASVATVAAQDVRHGASPAHTGLHEQKRRHECARFLWYEEDGLADLADWSRVACSDEELHLCQVEEGASSGFNLGSGRFPQTRFVAHGNPALIVSDPLAVQIAGAVGCIPDAAEGTSYTGTYHFVVRRPA